MEEEPTKPSTTTSPTTRSQFERRPKQQNKFKGNSYAVTTPSQVAAPKPVQQKQSQPQPANTSFQNKTYVCSLCQDNHLLYYCPTFTGYNVAKRKEFVMNNKLCLNCLKPQHVAAECRSAYRCRESGCQKKHNTLLHEDRPPAVTTQQVNFASHHTNSDEKKSFVDDGLLMTTQVTLTGPTDNTITVRALLDSGSAVSLISKKMMKLQSQSKLNPNLFFDSSFFFCLQGQPEPCGSYNLLQSHISFFIHVHREPGHLVAMPFSSIAHLSSSVSTANLSCLLATTFSRLSFLSNSFLSHHFNL